MLNIRPYNINDKDKVQQLCLVNAGCEFAPKNVSDFELLMNCNYYIEQESQNCFVAVNDRGDIVGYILCAENYDKYESIFKDNYLNRVESDKFIEAKLNMLSHSMFRFQYPSHMKIVVSDAYRRLGYGSLLLSVLKAHLRKKGCNSLLTIYNGQDKATGEFLKKAGFKNLIQTKLGTAMLLDFENSDENSEKQENIYDRK